MQRPPSTRRLGRRVDRSGRPGHDAMVALIEGCQKAIARGLAAAGYSVQFSDYEDAEQDALAAIVEGFPSTDLDSPCGWMHNVARNRAIGRTRSKEVRRRGTQRLMQQATATDLTHTDDYAVDEALNPAELASLVVGALPPGYREVVVAYHLDGLTVPEIADSLSIARDTVYTRLRRARKAMLQVLKEHGHV